MRTISAITHLAKLLLVFIAIWWLTVLATMPDKADALFAPKVQESCWMQVEGQNVDPCQNPNAPVTFELGHECIDVPPALKELIDRLKAEGQTIESTYCGVTK